MAHRADVYISADIEADGPIPGPYSMLSFGMCVAGTFDGEQFTPCDPTEKTFYVELKPISDAFIPGALAVSGLDRDLLRADGATPEKAMADAAAWVHSVAGDGVPVLVAYPLAFDWTWLYWYFTRYTVEGSPFGHSRGLDLKTFYAARAGETVSRSVKGRMPKHLLSKRPHTHHALEDAIEQAELCQNLFAWNGRNRDA